MNDDAYITVTFSREETDCLLKILAYVLTTGGRFPEDDKAKVRAIGHKVFMTIRQNEDGKH